MSKAFKCDRCLRFFNGDPEIKIKTNKLILAISYIPEAEEPTWYVHDLCNKDADEFKDWFTKLRNE